jgi:hypothetical protein
MTEHEQIMFLLNELESIAEGCKPLMPPYSLTKAQISAKALRAVATIAMANPNISTGYDKNAQGDELEFHGDFYTNGSFWDCECPSSYIHPKSQAGCPICCVLECDGPDSRENEVQDQVYGSRTLTPVFA